MSNRSTLASSAPKSGAAQPVWVGDGMDFFEEMAHRNVQYALSWLLRGLVVLIIALAAAQLVAIGWLASQCYTIYGVSTEGRVFEAHSFSCPNPGVSPIHHRKP